MQRDHAAISRVNLSPRFYLFILSRRGKSLGTRLPFHSTSVEAVLRILPVLCPVHPVTLKPQLTPLIALANNSLASHRIFLYFQWEEREGEESTSGHSAQLSVDIRSKV